MSRPSYPVRSGTFWRGDSEGVVAGRCREGGQMLDGLRPRVAPSEALSLGSLALEEQKTKGLGVIIEEKLPRVNLV